jgi:hypothetical protein
MTIRTSLVINERIKQQMNTIPREISISAIFRWVIKAAALSDAQFAKELEKDAELKDTHALVAPWIRGKIGVK